MPNEPAEVLRLSDIDECELTSLLGRYQLRLQRVAANKSIPGSYWGDAEAGLVADRLYARQDTPLHSILHEASHYICMDSERRRGLDTNAASDDAEESAVCYLQILLSDQLKCMGREVMFTDMDSWGYSFRLGCSRSWFEKDAGDASTWLKQHRLIDALQQPSYRLRTCPPG